MLPDTSKYLADLCKILGISLTVPFGLYIKGLAYGETKLAMPYLIWSMAFVMLGILILAGGYIITKDRKEL